METFVLALVFLVVSTLFSMLGLGGGVLYVPILLFAGYSMAEAPAISLILITATSLSALHHFSRNSKIDWKLALVMDPPTDIMAFVGGYFSAVVPEMFLRTTLIVVMLLVGVMMLRRGPGEAALEPREKRWWLWRREFHGVHYAVNLPLVLTATSVIGLLSGMLGITGGVIKLPIMVLLCGVPMDIAVATSTVMVAITAICGVTGHAVNGTIDWRTGLVLAIAAVAGGLIGSRISVKADKAKLKKIFGGVVLLIAIQMSIRLIFKHL